MVQLAGQGFREKEKLWTWETSAFSPFLMERMKMRSVDNNWLELKYTFDVSVCNNIFDLLLKEDDLVARRPHNTIS